LQWIDYSFDLLSTIIPTIACEVQAKNGYNQQLHIYTASRL